MTHMEAIAAVAQGVIDAIASDPLTVEVGSRIYRGMVAIVEEEPPTIAALKEIRRCIARESLDLSRARGLLDVLIAARVDPGFGT